MFSDAAEARNVGLLGGICMLTGGVIGSYVGDRAVRRCYKAATTN